MHHKVVSLYQSTRLLLACFLYALIRGRACKVPKHASRLVVTQIAKMGDTVLSTPVFHALRQKYPKSHLYAVCQPAGQRALEGSTDVDEVILHDSNAFKLATTLRSRKIDVGIITNTSPEIVAACFLAGVSFIVTFELAPTKRTHVSPSLLYRILGHLTYRKKLHIGQYMTRQYLSLLEPLGIREADTHLRLMLSESVLQEYRSQLAARHVCLGKDMVVVVAPGGKEIRRWPADRFSKLIDYLHKQYGAKVVLVGAGEDESAIDAVIQGLQEKVVYVNTLNQPLEELKALCAQADLVIANDSGPVTFAEAFDTPSVMIVGPTDEKEHHYEDAIHKMVVAFDRGNPVTHAFNWFNYDREEALRQIRAVSFEQVREAVDGLLSKHNLNDSLSSNR